MSLSCHIRIRFWCPTRLY